MTGTDKEKLADNAAISAEGLSSDIAPSFGGGKRPNRTFASRNTKRLVFVLCIIILPLLQNLIFYWGINLNSFRLAFSKYAGNTLKFCGFDNFKNIINSFLNEKQWQTYLWNSYKVYLVTFILYSPWGFFVYYFVYKFGKIGNAYKVIMFAPSLISVMITVSIYMYFMEGALPEVIRFLQKNLFKLPDNKLLKTGLLTGTPKLAFWSMFAMGFFTGMGSNLLIYVNAMNGISDSIVEAAKLDGVGYFGEFFHITFPMIFPLWKQFLVLGVVGILGNQFNLFEYYGTAAPVELRTLGYQMYIETITYGDSAFPRLSALGLLMTAVTMPTVMIIRAAMNKLDPMED